MKYKEDVMHKYLSFGGGVNSVAMMLLLLEKEEPVEAVEQRIVAANEAMKVYNQ